MTIQLEILTDVLFSFPFGFAAYSLAGFYLLQSCLWTFLCNTYRQVEYNVEVKYFILNNVV